MRLCLYIILILRQRVADFFVYAEHVGKLKISAVPLASRRLAHADKASAFVHKLPYARLQFLIKPFSAAAECRVCIAHVYNHVYIFRHAVPNVVERKKRHVYG